LRREDGGGRKEGTETYRVKFGSVEGVVFCADEERLD
jgi:hypothetical protein